MFKKIDEDEINFRFQKRRAITSYGIVLFTNDKGCIKYLIGQRRDSISYAEFLKNKLPEDVIKMHINLMSKEERKRCLEFYLNNNAESLWEDLWVNHKSRIYRNDYLKCCRSFKLNMEIYMNEFLDETQGKKENDWGFPKGRKMFSETELNCALREFEEETSISQKIIQVFKTDPIEEFYYGTDNKLYKTIYFVAFIPYYPEINYKLTPNRIRKKCVSEEISQIKWLSYKDTLKHLDDNKKRIIKNINETLLFKRRKKITRRYSC